VGRRTLELVRHFPERFRVEGLVARGSNLDLLREQILIHRPRVVGLFDEAAATDLARTLAPPRPEILVGATGISAVAGATDAAIVVSALVGAAGLLPTLAAIRAGKRVALANKEVLVMAGALMTDAARSSGVTLLPVDSEHNAIFQCLQGHDRGTVRGVFLTASGGPFAATPREALGSVKPADALKHPTWKMGAKITIDSATLMNKGLELIEAQWLFGLSLGQLQVLIHPQSIVHSLVEYVDGSVIAQLAMPDMGIPILYALTYPERLPCPAPRLDLTEVGALTFTRPDTEKFRCLALAREAARAGGTAPVVLNAVNEVAVAAFLDGRVGFLRIPELIEEALTAHPPRAVGSIEECMAVDLEARRWTEAAVEATPTLARR
jgi:1-deoxy-D-xylulose-5-phosphate reductoisomerase